MTLNNLAEWLMILLHLQTTSNNVYWTSTCQTLNEILYSFWLSEALDLLQTSTLRESILTITTEYYELDHGSITVKAHFAIEDYATEWVRLQKAWRRDLLLIMFSYQPSHIVVKNAITWAAMQAKYYYNMNWQPWFFIIDDEVLLWLHCEYKLPEIMNRKIEWQFVELFKVIECVK